MLKNLLAHRHNIYAWLMGVSIVLFAFRSISGIQIGFAISLVVLFILFFVDRQYRHKITLGSKFVYIPLLIICASIIVSGLFQYFNNHDSQTLLVRITLGVYFFLIYLIARIFGKELLKPFVYAVVVETISVIIYSLFKDYGVRNGGLVGYDYNIAVALLVFGAIVSVFYKQWIIVTIALIGLFFVGAEEGIIAVAVIFITILVRRDFSKKIILPICLLVVIAVLGIVPFSYTTRLYAIPIDKTSMILTGEHNEKALAIMQERYTDKVEITDFTSSSDYILNNRVNIADSGINEWDWLGSGYVLNPIDSINHPIYNVPLVIAQQVGILAALAWVFVTIYCLIKTRWRYAFIALIALGLLDNFIWCQLGVFWFVLVGVATASQRKNDLIFKDNICAV